MGGPWVEFLPRLQNVIRSFHTWRLGQKGNCRQKQASWVVVSLEKLFMPISLPGVVASQTKDQQTEQKMILNKKAL